MESFLAMVLFLMMALFLDESQRHLAGEACLAEDLLPWMPQGPPLDGAALQGGV